MSECEEYTPPMGEIRSVYADTAYSDARQDALLAAFDRAIAAHDLALREQIERLQATVHVLTSERDAALIRNGDLIVTHSAECERAWREGYDTGRRDYAGSVMGGMPISTPNPYTSRIARGEGSE